MFELTTEGKFHRVQAVGDDLRHWCSRLIGKSVYPTQDITSQALRCIQLHGVGLVGVIDDFHRAVLRSVAAGVGVTYESLSGDLSTVNFSSARMGRVEMDRNISGWQWLLLIPQLCNPVARWFMDGWALQDRQATAGLRMQWTPPRRILVDPTKEIPALIKSVRAGFDTRSNVIRQLGYDPEPIMDEFMRDAEAADARMLKFDSDPRHDQARDDETDGGQNNDE